MRQKNYEELLQVTGNADLGRFQYEKAAMKYAPPMSVKKNLAGLFQGSVRHLGVALVVSVSVMACADMSSKPAEDKLIDAAAPLDEFGIFTGSKRY